MSFIFQKTDGSLLQETDLLKLRSSLLEEVEVTLQVFSDQRTNAPGIYLKASSNLGEVKYPPQNSAMTDYSDLLHWGSLPTPKGLFVKIEDTWVAFNLNNGSNYRNKILLPQAVLDNSGVFIVKLKFIGNEAADTRRLYIGVEIDDS